MGQLQRDHEVLFLPTSAPVGTVTAGASTDWPEIAGADVLFLQRPFSTQHVMMMQVAKKFKIPVWIDFDDDLLSVPQSNGAWLTYVAEDTRKNVKYLQENADVVTVTTPYLAQNIPNKNTVVIPNAYDDILMHRKPQPEMQYKKFVLWRGTDTHCDDLMQVTPQIQRLAANNPDWIWLFMGWNPYFLTRLLPQDRAQYTPFQSAFQYLDNIQNLAPCIMMCPLVDGPFNRSKSNIAWIEGTFAGAAMVAPKWEEWDKPGVTAYESVADFEEKMQGLMNQWSPTYSEISYSYIRKNLMLSNVNKKRREVLDSLVK